MQFSLLKINSSSLTRAKFQANFIYFFDIFPDIKSNVIIFVNTKRTRPSINFIIEMSVKSLLNSCKLIKISQLK